MGSDIKRPAYSPLEASHVADAANLIAAEARAAGRTVLRPFNGSTLEGRPTWTAAHTVMWWHVDQERARDKSHDSEHDAFRARAEAAEQRAEAAEAEVARLRAELAQARAEGEAAGAAGAARERAAVVAYLSDRGAVIEDHRAVQDATGESRLVVVHVVPRDAAADIEAGAHVAPAAGGAR